MMPMGPSASTTSARAGLPFAGVPSELAERASEILEEEPTHPEPEVQYRHRRGPEARFNLRSFLAPRAGPIGTAVALVVLETIALQAGPLLTKIGIDQGVLAGRFDVLVAVTVAYLAMVAIGTMTSSVRIRYTNRLGESLMYQLRVRVFAHLQRQGLDFFTGERSGRLMTRMTSDIEALTQLFQDGLVNLMVQGLTLVVIGSVLVALNPLLGLITLVLVVPAMAVLTLWFRSASDRGYRAVRDRISELLTDLAESLAGIRLITAHNRREHNITHHETIVVAHRDANLHTARLGALYGSGSEMVGILGQAALLAIGGRMVSQGTLTVGELFAYLLYLTAFFAPIQQLIALYNAYQQGQAAMEKLATLLETQPSVAESETAVELPPIDGRIVLTGVDFGYVDAETGTPGPKILDGLDLEISAGESLAVVGATGAGKSTIAKLITRFYDPRAGSVSIDGHDLRSVTLESLRSQLGVVPQEPFLFGGSVRDNITFGRPDATDEEVAVACSAVGLDELIGRLPEGLDTAVHERGVSLSSGERQLLALARVFLARPRVLVLDEATSNLDLGSETRVERAVEALVEGRTAIVIAHRLATAMRADRIAVIDEGRVVELGSHDELVAAGGRYASMARVWSSHGGERSGSSSERGA